MNPEYILTVEDVLSRPLFHNAQIVAGERGLQRKIRWVHVMEVSQFDALLHGEEMILTTGVGLSTMPAKTYVEKLIESRVSCLCIELGHSLSSVSEEMIELADRHDFPLIVFSKTVRFVDITQDLHSLILNQHHKMLEDLEVVSREFHRLTLTSQGTTQILKLLHKSVNAQVAYLPLQGTPQFIPALSPSEQAMLIESLPHYEDMSADLTRQETMLQSHGEGATYLIQVLGAMGQAWGRLALLIRQREPREFDTLILDRASLALSQDLLRKKYMDERRAHAEQVWVDDLIHGRIKSEEQIRALIGSRLKEAAELHYRVCIVEPSAREGIEPDSSEEDFETTRLHIALRVRSVFDNLAFYPLMTWKNNRLVIVAIDLSPRKNHKERWERIFDTLQSRQASPQTDDHRLHVGIGRTYRKLMDAHHSYREAQGVLSVNRPLPQSLGPFYDDIGVYRLLLRLDDESAAKAFVDDYIGPLIEHDRNKGNELLRTLKAYFDHGGSKQLAAQALFLTRQTLYHRLNKIEQLIGGDLHSPERRLALEVAVRIYQWLNAERKAD